MASIVEKFFRKENLLIKISEFLTPEEKVLWQTEYKSSLIYSYSKVLISVAFKTLHLLFFSLVGLALYIYFENFFQNLNIFTLIILILIFFIFSIYTYHIIKRPLSLVYAFCITDKKLIFIVDVNFDDVGYGHFFSDIQDIESIEATSEKIDNYTKYNIKSYIYDSSKKFELFKTSSYFYVDEKGLEILTKLLKEKAPNCKINL